MEGDLLPVSAFEPRGSMPTGTSKYEKRGIATQVAQWTNPETCTQCNLCSALCPHAAIRPFLFTDEEGKVIIILLIYQSYSFAFLSLKAVGPDFESRKAKGKGKGLNYRVQISPFDCTGCEVCIKACPTSSLSPLPFLEVAEKQSNLWDSALKLPVRYFISLLPPFLVHQLIKTNFLWKGTTSIPPIPSRDANSTLLISNSRVHVLDVERHPSSSFSHSSLGMNYTSRMLQVAL